MQVFTGKCPFPELSDDAIALAICGGGRPPRPADPAVPDQLWQLMQECWNEDPQLRPTPEEVLLALESTPPVTDQGQEGRAAVTFLLRRNV